jgi:hypothetical protein
MANTFEKIQTVTVGAGGAATIEFTSIPQTYTDLKLFVSPRNTASFSSNGYYYLVKPNNSSSNLSSKYMIGIGTSVASGTYTPYGYMAASDYTANVFANNEHYFPNYTSANYKSMSTDSVNQTNGSIVYALQFDGGLWSNTSAITSIVLSPGVGNFAQYSSATLYGIKNT